MNHYKLNLQLFAVVPTINGNKMVKKKKDENIDILDPTQSRVIKKSGPSVPKIVKSNVQVAPVSTEPVETDLARQSRELFERQQAFAKSQAEKGIEDPTAVPFEERQKRQLANQVTETTTPVVPEITAEQLRQDLLRLEEQKKLNELSRSSEQALQAVRDREALIAPKIKGLKSTASVSTQLAGKRLKDIFAATGTEAGAGVAQQIAGEQGLQSQLGALDVQEAQERASVAKDIADIQSEKAFLERQIRAGTATAETQAQLESLQAEQEAAAREAEINSEREFQLFKQSLDNFNEVELVNLKNALERDNTVLDAEIQRLRDIQLFEQDSQIKAQAAEDARRLQGMRNSNAVKIAEMNNEANLAEIEARGVQDRLTDSEQARLSGEDLGQADDRFPDSTFTANISQQLRGTDEFTPVEEVNRTIALGIMDQVRQGNITNDTQLLRLLTRYNLTEAEVDAILAEENAAQQRSVTPGVGGLNIGG